LISMAVVEEKKQVTYMELVRGLYKQRVNNTYQKLVNAKKRG